MPAGTSLGEGIGLQEPRRDDRWMMQLARDNAARDAAEAKRREESDKALVKETDFKIDYKSFLPPYAKAIAKIEGETLNKLASMRQGGKYLPEATIRMEALKARQAMNSYIIGNANAMGYIKDDKIMKDQDLVGMLQSSETSFDDLEKATSSHPFLRVSKAGDFSFYPISNEQIKPDYGNPDIQNVEPLNRIGRVTFNREYKDYTPESVIRAADQLSANQNWALQTLFKKAKEDPQNYGRLPNESTRQYIDRVSPLLGKEALKEAEKLKPPRTYGRILPVTDPAPSGSKTKEKWTAPVEDNATATIYTGKKDKDGNPEYGETIYDISQRLDPNMKPFTVSASANIIDANTNQFIPKKSYNFSFKPDRIVTIRMKSDGSKKKYILGSTVKPVEGGDYIDDAIDYYIKGAKGEKQEKTSKLLVPYEGSGVRSAIDATNDLTEFNRRYDELSKSGSYSKAQEQGIKNVMDRNGISREDAIKALKDAGKL